MLLWRVSASVFKLSWAKLIAANDSKLKNLKPKNTF